MTETMERYDPQAIEAKWQKVWADEQSFHVPNPVAGRADGRPREVVRRRDAPVPVGRSPHGAYAQLHDRRRDHAHAPAQGDAGAAADGLRRVRPAGRERCDQGRRAPAHRHRAQHRVDPRADAPHGLGDRLGARDLDARAGVLPLDAVAVPALLRERARVPQGGARQVVPERPDGARERAGRRRSLRALRRGGRGEEPDAVVLPDHRLRRRAARRDGAARAVARARAHDAAQLDRPLAGRARRLQRRGERGGAARLHDPARHAVRRDVLRPGARAPARGAARRRLGARGRGARLRPAHGRALRGRARGRRRRTASSPGGSRSTPSTASRSRSGSPTTS